MGITVESLGRGYVRMSTMSASFRSRLHTVQKRCRLMMSLWTFNKQNMVVLHSKKMSCIPCNGIKQIYGI